MVAHSRPEVIVLGDGETESHGLMGQSYEMGTGDGVECDSKL